MIFKSKHIDSIVCSLLRWFGSWCHLFLPAWGTLPVTSPGIGVFRFLLLLVLFRVLLIILFPGPEERLEIKRALIEAPPVEALRIPTVVEDVLRVVEPMSSEEVEIIVSCQ